MWQVFQWSFDRGLFLTRRERDRDFRAQWRTEPPSLHNMMIGIFWFQESRMETKMRHKAET